MIRKTQKQWEEEWKAKGFIPASGGDETEFISEEAAKGAYQRRMLKKKLGNLRDTINARIFLARQERAEKHFEKLDDSVKGSVEEVKKTYKEILDIDAKIGSVDNELVSLMDREKELLNAGGKV